MRHIKRSSKTLYSIVVISILMLALLFGFYRVLHNGLSVEKLTIGPIKIEGFYLGLNKKLLLRADLIDLSALLETQNISRGSKNTSLEMEFNIIKGLEFFLDYFEEIYFANVLLNNHTGIFLYQENLYFIALENLHAYISLEKSEKSVVANIQEILYKPYNARFTGKATYDIFAREASISGLLDLNNTLEISLEGESDFRTVKLQGTSKPFASLAFLKDIIAVENPHINAWLYDNFQSDGIQLTALSFESKLDLDSLLDSLQKRLYVRADVASPVVTFAPNTPPLHAKGVTITYDKSGLIFKPHEPIYQNYPIEAGSVKIKDLWGENPTLGISLQGDIRLDEDVQKVLHAFEISVPLIQESSLTKTKLELDFNLMTQALAVNGSFDVENAYFLLEGFRFYTPHATVVLENSTVWVAPISQIQVESLLDSTLGMTINLDERSIEGRAKVASFSLGDGEIASLQNEELPFNVLFGGRETSISFPSLHARLLLSGQTHAISLEDLSLLYPYSKLLQEQNIPKGRAFITTKDFTNFDLTAYLDGLSYPLQNRDKTPIANLAIQGEITPDYVNINTIDYRIVASTDLKRNETTLLLKDIGLLLPEGSSANKPLTTTLKLRGQDCSLFFKRKTILANTLEATLLPSNQGTATITYGAGSINLNYRGKTMTVEGKNLPDRLVNTFFNKEIIDGGQMQLTGKYDGEVFNGDILLTKGVIQNLHLLQNFFAFADTIPSLLMFRNPGFNTKGYAIEKGKITFGITDQYAVIENFLLDGTSMDTEGNGIIDLSTEEIDFRVKLVTMKSLGTLVSNIPIVGYVLMGNDGSFSTNIHVTGTLDKPKTQSDLAGSAIKAPLNILERIIKAPAKLLE